MDPRDNLFSSEHEWYSDEKIKISKIWLKANKSFSLSDLNDGEVRSSLASIIDEREKRSQHHELS